MMAAHWDVSQFMSRELVSEAQGWLRVSYENMADNRSPTQEDDDSVTLRRDEAEQEDVLAATVVAWYQLSRAKQLTFRGRLAECAVLVEDNLLVLSLDEVVDNMGR